MSDAVPPMNSDDGPASGPVPYVPQSAPAGEQNWAQVHAPSGAGQAPSGFNPRAVVHPDGLSRREAQQAQVPAPYPAHPGWAGQAEAAPKKASLLDRLMPRKDEEAAPVKSSGPVKPFVAGFLFGVSFVLIVGYGWNDPEPVGPSWTLPTAPAPDAESQDPAMQDAASLSSAASDEW